MIDGEGAPAAEVASPDPLRGFSPEPDAPSPAASRYSSCGESDDAERYCSANSAMGTPSLCSSLGTFHECLDFELGSVKSFGPGEVSGLETLSLGGTFSGWSHKGRGLSSSEGFDCLGEITAVGNFDSGKSSFSHGDASFSRPGNAMKVSGVLDGNVWRELGENGELQNVARNGSCDEKADDGVGNGFGDDLKLGLEESPDEHLNDGYVGRHIEESNSKSCFQLDEEAGKSSVEDELSSYEHSEGEESMYGVDDEHKFNSVFRQNMEHGLDMNTENGNILAMNLSTAFGSDDWDDFVLESGDSAATLGTLYDLHELRHAKLEIKENLNSLTSMTLRGVSESEKSEDASDSFAPSNQVLQHTGHLSNLCNSSDMTDASGSIQLEHGNVIKKPETSDEEYLESCTIINSFETEQDPMKQGGPSEAGLSISDGRNSESHFTGLTSQLEPCSKIDAIQVSASTELPKTSKVELVGNYNDKEMALGDAYKPVEFTNDQPSLSKTDDLEPNRLYNEVVHDMEEILLDASESPGPRFHQANIVFQSHRSVASRDGGSSASTSSIDDANLPLQTLFRIDGVEVIGAKQKRGDVSLGERLVGVKEYTVYKLRVWGGKDQWEVERRYRDFSTLYRRLKSLYSDQGWILPSPWSFIERESRKIFGNVSPDVIAQRSALIQECLQSVLYSRGSSNLPSAFILFLSPQKGPSVPTSNSLSFSTLTKGTDRQTAVPYGKTISLMVEVWPRKSIKQILEAQQYSCAGCHKYFDDGKTRIEEFVQTFGWGKPRLCEYTGQLFCSSCHTNDTAVLPARVLHNWDFTQYPVSQLAKSYLDSIRDKPMLCLSAVNPFLFSKVPALLHVMDLRKKLAAMLPNIRCPFRRSIYKGLGSRRYLLESNDFFALRDLVDLSKGAFAGLPLMVETVSRKLLEHITEQCLVCCDSGIPCGARQACDDPSSLIFPFQEGEVEKCRSCDLVFHKHCFEKLINCSCGVHLNAEKPMALTNEASLKAKSVSERTLVLSERSRDPKSRTGFLSGLLSKAMQEKLWGTKDGENVILMGSLPSTSL